MILQLIYRPTGEPVPVRLPLSKSMAIRVMAANAVSRRQGAGETRIPEMSECEDALHFRSALRSVEEGKRMINIGEGGTPLRFFIALMASMEGVDVTVTCGRSLMRRPLKPLLDALAAAGADIRCERHEGYPPLRILGRQLGPERLTIDPSVSSQFISALMLAAPLWRDGLRLGFGEGKPVSTPYIAMTAEVLERFGADVVMKAGEISVAPGQLTPPEEFPVETDWSAASYFYELALLLPGKDIPVKWLSPAADSLQGDAACQSIFSLLGVQTLRGEGGEAVLRCDEETLKVFREMERPLELDLNSTPDLVPAITVGLCFAGVKFRLTGIDHLRHKESNRLQALANELEKVGYQVSVTGDGLSWLGARTPVGENETIATYSDHRIAMAFAPAAVKLPYLAIEDPEVVGKSFPDFWKVLEGLGFEIKRFGGAGGARRHRKA